MVNTSRYPLHTSEWTKLPQYEDRPIMSDHRNKVDVEGIGPAMEEKLCLPQSLRRKRPRADSVFGAIEESSAKRIKVPELKRVQAEQFPAFTGMITIYAKNKNRKRQPLSLHIERDRASSEFIAQSLMSDFFSDWNTTLPKPIDLTHEDPSLVKHYVQWVNTRNISTRKKPRRVSQQEKSRPDYKEEMTLDTEQLALCYSLGERLEDAQYCNALLCTMRYYGEKEEFPPSDRAVAVTYDQTSSDSPVMKMMVDFWAYAGNPLWLESKSVRNAICTEFFDDLRGKRLSRGQTMQTLT
ncbi:hypothetical protein PMIN02_004362 [Paraphaeosphaeria minitans]|uniref:BTB domain-containing protein n=1 Tax=Paraphaeosphaeria minitans TaxID=565426 RepID=A0A9P6KM97_9PLEO|nr:hypothetical protein PMIN01_10473 [Paraphaeosphaeria minitans]